MKDYLKEKVITKHSKGLLTTGKTKDTLVQSEKRPTCSGKNEKKEIVTPIVSSPRVIKPWQ